MKAPVDAEPAARPSQLRRARDWLLQIALVVVVYVAVSAWQERHSAAEGQDAPAFQLTALDGGTVSSATLRGQRVLLHFWATWCGVCRAEVSSLNAIAADLPEGTRVVSIVADADDPAALRRFVREHDIRYPVLLGDDATLRSFGIAAFPTNYYLDERGFVRDVTVGLSTRWSMRFRLWLAD